MPPSKPLSNADIIRLLELFRVEYDCVVPEDIEQEVTLQKIAKAMNLSWLGPKEIAVKFKYLKKVYLEELKKVEESKASGADALSVYVPSVYWFPTMQALLGPRNQNQTLNICIPGPVKHEADDNDDPDDPAPREAELSSDRESCDDEDTASQGVPTGVGAGADDSEDKSCSPLELELPAVPERPGGIMADTLDHFGRYLASILRELPHARSYSLQRKFINEAIATRQQHPTDASDGDTRTTATLPKTDETKDCSEQTLGTAPDKKRRKRRRSTSPNVLSSNEPTSTIVIKEEVQVDMDGETTRLPSSDQEPSRTDEDAAFIDMGEEVKREYDGSGFEVVYCDSDSNQTNAPGTSTAKHRPGSLQEVAPDAQPVKKKNGRFTCKMCSIIFPNYIDFWSHAREKHAEHNDFSLLPSPAEPATSRMGKRRFHTMLSVEDLGKKNPCQRKCCKECQLEGKIVKTVYFCQACPGLPGLCAEPCFDKYHEYLDD